MNAKRRVEGVLTILYTCSVVLSLVSIVSLVVAWQHWKPTLDVCLNMDCGCILYGVTTFSVFMGGDVKVCTFGVYALVPVVLFALSFAAFHGYRSCIERTYDNPRVFSQTTYCNDRTRPISGLMIETSERKEPFKQWMTTAFLAVIICCLSLSHAVVLTDGYYKTCEHYKRTLVKLLNSPTRIADVIHNRLDCAAVLDYMDYLQPDANNWVRTERINTKISLQLAIVMTWFNVFTWLAILIINFMMGRRRSRSIGETFCCCLN